VCGLLPFHFNFVSLLFVIGLPPSLADQKKRNLASHKIDEHLLIILRPSITQQISDGEKSSVSRMISKIDKAIVVRIKSRDYMIAETSAIISDGI